MHGIYQEWRRIADSYPGERVLIGEVWLPDAERLTRYLRPGELHSAFNFDFLCCAWDSARLREVMRSNEHETIRQAIERLSNATMHLAELIMNAAISKALKDKRVREIQ